jgi:hypothetical protein
VYDLYADFPALVPGDVRRCFTNCTDDTAAVYADAELLKLLAASTTHSTKRSYDSDLRHFAAWGGLLPATSLDLARYLAAYARRLSVATLARRLAAIRQAHTLSGLPKSGQERPRTSYYAGYPSYVRSPSASCSGGYH